jgi:N-acyl-D-amino-acid deacylase
MYDILIKNANIIDGTGRDAYQADLGIADMRIVNIGDLGNAEAGRVIDAAGRTVTPGFIDMHSHADYTVLAYPKMESMLNQGITTFVGCQCGHSVAPAGRLWESMYAYHDILCKISIRLYADMFDRDNYSPTKDMAPYLEREHGFSPTWASMGAFMDEVDRRGLSGNLITLSGYNTLRLNAADPDEPSKLNADQRSLLKAQIREALEAGAFGMSTGLDYKPGLFCDTAELVEMAAELKPFDGIYFTHWRKTGQRSGTPKRQKKIAGIIEALEIARRNEVQVEICHLSTGFDIFPGNDDFMQVAAAQRTLQVIDEYTASGVRAYLDVIPNITGGTTIAPDLAALFRPWYMVAGGLRRFIQNLHYPDYRKQIADVIMGGRYYALNPAVTPDWDEWIRVIGGKDGSLVGKTVKEIADALSRPALETLFDLLVADPQIKVFMTTHSMNIKAVHTYLSHPLATVGNDTFVFDLQSSMAWDPQYPFRKPNPNTYCGFVKYLTELGMPRFEDTIRKPTGKAAEVLGLTDRGLIKTGYRADVLVIDRGSLKSNENLIEPRVYPNGIPYVLVNGQIVIDNGVHTGRLPGGTIRRQSR